MATEKIMVGIDDKVIELTGDDLDAFIADRDAITQAEASRQAEAEKKSAARASALLKLKKLGLSAAEIEAL